MHVKGKLEEEGPRMHLTANVDGQILKSFLVDECGMLHLFTKVCESFVAFNGV